jgi:hypothetical protein
MEQPKFHAEHTPPEYTLVITLFHVIFPPLHSLTTKLFAFMLHKIQEYISEIFILSVAFFPTKPVPGLNRICHSCIQIEFGNSQERKFCVPVSVKSNHVAKVILPSSLAPDNFAKYNPEKLDTLLLIMLEKLFKIPCSESTVHIDV